MEFAYEVAQAMSFEVHERIINYFFFELKKEPMEGFCTSDLATSCSSRQGVACEAY